MMLRSTATTATSRSLLWSLERRLANLSIRPFASQAAAAAATAKPFPSNLSIDSRSSFAPQRVSKKILAIEKEEEGDDQDDNVVAQAEVDEDDAYYDSDDDDEDGDFHFESPEGIPVIPLPDRLHVPVYHFGASSRLEEAGTIWLDSSVFGMDPIRVDLLKRAVDYYRAKKRGRRKAKTKTIAEIRGSGRKQRPQKGQGTARAGHKKVGHWRGGAKAHGPTNATDYGNIKLNKKVKKLAIKNVLAAKLKQGDLLLVNQFHTLPTHKTKELVEWLAPFGVEGRDGRTALLLDHYYPPEEADSDAEHPQAVSYRGVPVNLRVAAGNLRKVKLGNQQQDLNVYDVLKYEKLILSLDALAAIEARYKDV